MKKIPILLLLFIIYSYSGCSTVTDNNRKTHKETAVTDPVAPVIQIEPLNFFSIETYPGNDSFSIAAFSPRFQNHEDEILFVKANAARQLAIYYGAYLSYQKYIDENASRTLEAQKIEVLYDQDLALSFMDRLDIVKEISGNDYYAAIVTMKNENPPHFPQIELTTASRPKWISKPPDSEDYHFGVGISQRRKTIVESWEQSDKQAMAEIANSLSTTIQSGSGSIERGNTTSSESTSVGKSLFISDVNIKGLYILSRWREPDSSYYYSLAICRKQ